MKNKKRFYKALALLLTLVLLLGTVSTGADDENTGTADPVYSDWLDLNNLRKGPGETSGTRSESGRSSDLADFLDGIEVTGVEPNEGVYTILEGVPYTIQMHFSEKTDGIQFEAGTDGCVLTYKLPAGFKPIQTGGSGYLTGNGGIVQFDYEIIDGTLTVTLDKTSPGYLSFLNAENTKIDLYISGIITQEEVLFSSEVTGDFNIDNTHQVTVQKTGSYDAARNQIKFTVQAFSVGRNTDIHIVDIITGTALTYDSSTFTISSNIANPVQYIENTQEGETFGLTIPSMQDDEIVTIEYYADVELSLLDKENGRYGTIEQTGNSVYIYNLDGPPDHHITIYEKDFEHRIALSSNSKTASSQTVRNGKTYVTWTIVLNENANVSIAGSRVKDTIDTPSIMRYSGDGIHIERYKKDGTPAGTYDVQWGTNGLTESSGGSTWTYTIPERDEGQAYKYVITYETEVDSDVFLKSTDVNNKVWNDYDTDYSGITIEPTGEPVKAEKKAVQSTVDRVQKKAETEWEITFTVPATGLDSAVIIDTLPRKNNYNDGVEYYDTYKENSVRIAEGDLLEGESFSPNLSQDGRTVTITFTKNNNQPGLTGTGETRTIHVFLTTIASREWLLYAESVGPESVEEFRKHTNNVDVWVNGQDIHKDSTVMYNTSNYDIEKVLSGTYLSNENLPIYVYRIILKGMNDSVFDSDGYLTITDKYVSHYLVFEPPYNVNIGDSNHVNVPNGYVYANNLYDIDTLQEKGSYVVDESSSEGQLVFKLKEADFPKIGSSYYTTYSIVYALQIREDALAEIRDKALHSNGLKVELKNTAYNGMFGTSTIVTDYAIKDPLTKEILTKGDNNDTGTYDIQFSIKVNPDGLKIGDADTITVKDTVSNLSFDYTSIVITPPENEGGGETVDYDGNSLIFTLCNETPYTITYITRLNGSQNVHWNNKAELFGYIAEMSDTTSSSASGSYQTYHMNVKKHAEGNLNHGLVATFEIYEARVKDSNGNDIDITEQAWRKVGEFTTAEGTGIWKIETVTDADGTERSLRPYSFLDNDGNEKFGNDYGWRYRIKETVAPVGYQRTSTIYEFGISDFSSENTPYNYLNGGTVTIPNHVPQTDVEISGKKELKGRELKDQEFTFILSPEQNAVQLWGADYPGGIDDKLTAKNNAAGVFSFSPLSFTYDDYMKAKQRGFADANDTAYFYYVTQEEIPTEAEGNLLNGVRYDISKFLVVVRLYMDGDELKAQTSYYPYDGSIPTEFPRPPQTYLAGLHVTGRATK